MNTGQWEPNIVNWPSIEGSPMPLGVTYIPEERAYNFALYSKNATEVTLLLFKEGNHVTPIVEVWLEPLGHKTKRVWHCRLKENRSPPRQPLCLSRKWSQRRRCELQERF